MRLLLVEDDATSREILADFLSDSGHQIVETDSAEAAFRLIDDVDDLDMLVTDFHLAGAHDGVDVMDAFWRRHPHTCVVMVSGEPQAALAKLAGRAGASFLQKPFRLTELAERLDAAASASR